MEFSNVAYWHNPDLRIAAHERPFTNTFRTLGAEGQGVEHRFGAGWPIRLPLLAMLSRVAVKSASVPMKSGEISSTFAAACSVNLNGGM
jgi:hypothetical protein